MVRTRVFRSGNSQAVRLPAGFRLQGPEVEIVRRGDEIVLREVGQDGIRRDGLARAFSLIADLPIEAGLREDGLREDGPPQDREGL